MEKSPAIGIDLGTTYTCVGVFRNGRAEIIPDEQGPRTTPSYVAFTDFDRLIGGDALDQACTNCQNTIYDVKRFIGRNFQDEGLKIDMKLWPFKVIDHEGYPKVQVEYKGETIDFYPQEISTMILRKMKEIAEAKLGTEVTKAVITVPAYFNDSQRQATKDAATIAGLEVMSIINEPTAAAIAFRLMHQPKNQNVLVFDFGGGTFDVSILNISNRQIVVKSTCGDSNLGGKDIDDLFVDHLMQLFEKKYEKDISNDPRSLAKLRESAEKAKRNLSSRKRTSVDISALFDGITFSHEIRIAEFNHLCEDIFQRTLTCVEKALEDASMTKTDIEEVILVGGSSRIPRVQELLQTFFGGKKLNKTVNPEEIVAEGAAIHAAFLNGETDARLITFKDVISKSLGLKLYGGVSKVIIPRNSTIPCSKLFEARMNGSGTYAVIQVFESDELTGNEVNILTTIRFNTRTRDFFAKFSNWFRKSDKVELKIQFSVNLNGILNVWVQDKNGNVHNIPIKNGKSLRPKEELDRLIEDATRFEEKEKKETEREEALTRLELYCGKMLDMTVSDDIPILCKDPLIAAHGRAIEWISQNRFAKKEEIENRERYLKKIYETTKEMISELK